MPAKWQCCHCALIYVPMLVKHRASIQFNPVVEGRTAVTHVTSISRCCQSHKSALFNTGPFVVERNKPQVHVDTEVTGNKIRPPLLARPICFENTLNIRAELLTFCKFLLYPTICHDCCSLSHSINNESLLAETVHFTGHKVYMTNVVHDCNWGWFEREKVCFVRGIYQETAPEGCYKLFPRVCVCIQCVWPVSTDMCLLNGMHLHNHLPQCIFSVKATDCQHLQCINTLHPSSRSDK